MVAILGDWKTVGESLSCVHNCGSAVLISDHGSMSSTVITEESSFNLLGVVNPLMFRFILSLLRSFFHFSALHSHTRRRDRRNSFFCHTKKGPSTLWEISLLWFSSPTEPKPFIISWSSFFESYYCQRNTESIQGFSRNFHKKFSWIIRFSLFWFLLLPGWVERSIRFLFGNQPIRIEYIPAKI